MSEETKFSLTLTGPQMDYVGKFVVDSLNAANAQAKMAAEVYQVLKAAVTEVQQAQAPQKPAAPAARMTIVQTPEQESEAPVSNA